MEDRLVFEAENGEKLELELIEQATIVGVDYILTQSDDQAYILKCVSIADDDVLYEMLDGDEAIAVAKVFANMLEDVDIVL